MELQIGLFIALTAGCQLRTSLSFPQTFANMSTPQKNKSPSLPPLVLKGLLQEVEVQRMQCLLTCNLKEVCNNNTTNFGAAGTELRRKVQSKVDVIKRAGIHRYIDLLRENGIGPSTATLDYLRSENEKAAANGETIPPPPSLTPTEESSTEDVSEEEKLSSVLAGMNVDDDEEEHVSSPPPNARRNRRRRSSSCHIVNAYPLYQGLNFLRSNGSRTFPWIVFVNPEQPWAHGQFDVERVEGMMCGDFRRNGYHCRIGNVHPCDVDLWESYIPKETDWPYFLYRCIMIKGPSQSHLTRDPQKYHENLDVPCSATENQHLITCQRLEEKGNEEHKWAHYLLLFSVGVKLDNSIFSKLEDARAIEAHYVPQTMPKNDPQNDFGKELLGLSIYWRIAEQGGERVHKKKSTVNKKNLFGR